MGFSNLNYPAFLAALAASVSMLYAAQVQAVSRDKIRQLAAACIEQAESLGALDRTPEELVLREQLDEGRRCYRFDLLAGSRLYATVASERDNVRLFLAGADGTLIERGGRNGTITHDLAAGSDYALLLVKDSRVNTAMTGYELSLRALFLVDEAMVSTPGIALPDPEIDQTYAQVTWQDDSEQLWVADIDPATGDFLMHSSTLVDTDLAPIFTFANRSGTGNGPEWVYGADGPQILYTKALGTTQFDWYIYGAKKNAGGQWESGPLSELILVPGSSAGLVPIGSMNPGDATPRLVYLLPSSDGDDPVYMAWRDVDQAQGAIVSRITQGGTRWVDAASNALVYVNTIDGIDQVFLHEVVSGETTQLTSGTIYRNTPFVWRAPELGGDLVLMTAEGATSADKAVRIGIYRSVAGELTMVNEIRPPSDKGYIRSAEPFVFDGTSYISMLMEDRVRGPSEVWIAEALADDPLYRMVSDPFLEMVRNDPEAYITESGAIIYYNERGSRAVYRAHTGLFASE